MGVEIDVLPIKDECALHDEHVNVDVAIEEDPLPGLDPDRAAADLFFYLGV